MKTIIAGSREVTDPAIVTEAVKASGFTISEVVSGRARGVDRLGEEWARSNNIQISPFEPKWSIHGKAAGPIRNREMAEYADALIAIWDGSSRGTRNMIETAKELGLKVYVHATTTTSRLPAGSA